MQHCDPLSPYTREYESTTPSITAQRTFAQRLRGVLGRINAAIRRGIIQDDIFNLQEESDTLAVDDPGPFETDDSTRQTILFIRWLREQLNTEFLEVVGPDSNQWVRKAYSQGIRDVHQQLQDADIAFQRPDIDELTGRPFHTSSLQELFSRTYENLESVADDMVDEVRDSLLEGFREGENPTKIARRLRDRVNSIGKHRATMIARSEVMNARSEGTLSRVEELNEDAETEIATGHGEWDAAMGSDRTCAFCRALNGVELTPQEMRGTTVVFAQDGQVYRLKPPAHPSGRCGISLRVGFNIDTPLQERLPESVRVVT